MNRQGDLNISEKEVENMAIVRNKIEELQEGDVGPVEVVSITHELDSELGKDSISTALDNLKKIGKVFEPVEGHIEPI